MIRLRHSIITRPLVERLLADLFGKQPSSIGEKARAILGRLEPGLLLRSLARLLAHSDETGRFTFDELAPGEALITIDRHHPDFDAFEQKVTETLDSLALISLLPITVERSDEPGELHVFWPPDPEGDHWRSWLESLVRQHHHAPPPADNTLLMEVDQLQSEKRRLETLVDKLRSTLAIRDDELAHAEAKTRAFVEDLAIGIFLLAPDGRIELPSSRAAELLDVPASVIEGQPLSKIVKVHEDEDALDRLCRRAREGEKIAAFEVRRVSIGAIRYHLTLAPLEGGPRVIGTIQRSLRPELSQRLVEAQRLEAIGRMASALAHQINNPSASVRLNLETALRLVAGLESGKLELTETISSSLATSLEEALHETERIASTLADLNAYSDERTKNFSRVDVDLAIARAVRLLENRLRHLAKLEIDFNGRCDVLADDALFSQVVVNLLSNAATAIEHGQRHPGTIWVRSHRVGDRVTIEVSDDGCGMDPADFQRLRMPLVTGWKSMPSTGLGLATCDRVLSAMGGTLSMTPRTGGGTTILVTIPVAGESLQEAPPKSVELASRPVERQRVLMVDDERPILRAFTRLLSAKCDVTTAESIDQLEEILDRGERFDLVLCDLMMPQRSIVDAYDDLRARFPWLHRRLVICTGGGFSDEARSFVGEKGIRMLDKPFSPEAFDKVLAEMPGRKTDSWMA